MSGTNIFEWIYEKVGGSRNAEPKNVWDIYVGGNDKWSGLRLIQASQKARAYPGVMLRKDIMYLLVVVVVVGLTLEGKKKGGAL